MITDKRLERLLSENSAPGAYRRFFPRTLAPYVNGSHRAWAEAPLHDGSIKIEHRIKGSLRREDAATIYELAYFSQSDTVDLGTNWGLSAFIAAQALTDAGRGYSVTTIDLDAKMSERATKAFVAEGQSNVTAIASDAAAWLVGHATDKQKLGFAFVDHSHAYQPVFDVCKVIAESLQIGAHIAFHDFIDHRNMDPANDEFKVPQAARDGLDDRFVFLGVSGCVGVFRFDG